MITETPIIRYLSIEIQTATGGFVLGRSLLNADDLGSGADDLVWVPYTGSVTKADIKRGGKRGGVVNTMAVGTLTLTLKDSGDPLDTPDMRPNTPIRVRSTLLDTPIFTASIFDIDQSFTLDKRTGKITTFTTIVAVDAVQSHANTNRSGAIAPAGYERWEERIARLAASSSVLVNVPAIEAPIVRYSL